MKAQVKTGRAVGGNRLEFFLKHLFPGIVIIIKDAPSSSSPKISLACAKSGHLQLSFQKIPSPQNPSCICLRVS